MTGQASYYKYIKLWLLWQQAGAQPASRSRRDDRPGPSGNT